MRTLFASALAALVLSACSQGPAPQGTQPTGESTSAPVASTGTTGTGTPAAAPAATPDAPSAAPAVTPTPADEDGVQPAAIDPGVPAAAGNGASTPADMMASQDEAAAEETPEEPAVTAESIVPTLDGFLWIGKCSPGGAGLDCNIFNDQDQCPNKGAANFEDRGAFRRAQHQVGGTPGTRYDIDFEVRGVAGGKFYTGGTLRSPTGFTEGAEGNDGWYEGGRPTDSLWNTYEIHVTPPVPGAANTYYLNAFPVNSGFDGRHSTFVMKYEASFPVLGGGTIEMVIHDSNCLGQQNCGQTTEGQAVCSAPRTVDLSGMSPPPPDSFTQPLRDANNATPQWLFFDVKSVSAVE